MLRLIVVYLALSLIFKVATAFPADTTKTQKVMVFSDIHFSPFADCPAAKNCPLINELNHANAKQWPQILRQYSATTLPANGHPTNFALFDSLLTQIQQQRPDMVLILGDFLAHRFRSQYLKYSHDHNRADYNRFVLNTFEYLTEAIQQSLPAGSVILPVVGNNDSIGGKDCAYTDYCVITNGSFYQTLAKQWSALLPNVDNKNSLQATFSQAGYYEIVLPNTHNHILVLNTGLFSTQAQGPNIDKAAQEQLQWIRQKLQSIKNANEKAWILFHIPPGIDAYSTIKNFGAIVPYWDPTYSKPFLQIVREYNPVITAVLSGHTHLDGFLALDTSNPSHIISDIFIGSISPIYGNNPSYHIYTLDEHDFTLKKNTRYLLNLKNNNPTQGWQTSQQAEAAPAESNKLAYLSSLPISHRQWNYYWCATSATSTHDYGKCLKKSDF